MSESRTELSLADRLDRTSAMLAEIGGEEAVRRAEPMRRHTTFRIGGPAAVFAEPSSPEEFAKMEAVCREMAVPHITLGRGSNLLVSDAGYEGVVLHVGERMAVIRQNPDEEGGTIEAEAGAMLSAIARFARGLSLTGFEFAAGIPGTLGGALSMNAGAYGGEMKDVVTEVLVLLASGMLRWLPVDELAMGYRTSRIQTEGLTALGARIRLRRGDEKAITEKMNELAERRREKQPLEYPSAGSTFKRPEGYYAGKLIQDAGLAGYSCGDACVSEKHCGFVINRGHASAADVMQVIRHAQNTVREKYGVNLEMEVRTLGQMPEAEDTL